MTNVVYLPGVQPVEQDFKAAFTHGEIAHTALLMIARMVIEPHSKDLNLGFGTSDEGDGWMQVYTYTHVSRNWTQTLPVYRIEKTLDGYTARFFTRMRGRKLDYKSDTLRGIYEQTFSSPARKVSRALMKMHAGRVDEIAQELSLHPERRLTVYSSDPDALQSVNYKLIEEFRHRAAATGSAHADELVGSMNGVTVDG